MTRAEVRLGGNGAFTLKHAVLVYGDARRSFATVHAPIQGADDAAPVLGPGTPVSVSFLRALGDGLGAGLPLEVLPPSVLCRTPDVTVWWRPAGVAPVFYNLAKESKDDDALALKRSALQWSSGRNLPHPPLVFKATRSALWVRALATNERPVASTRLYEAPYFNVAKDGMVCLGSMRRPSSRGVGALSQWESGFFDSEFTHPLAGTRMTAFPGGFAKLWVAIALLGLSAFPTCALAPAPAQPTLDAFVRADTRGDD